MIARMSEVRPITILFADVSGSTKLFETRGDLEARRLISAVLNALGGVSEGHGGRVVKTIGDEVMCTFPSALAGMLAACDMQKRMSHDAEFVAERLGIRIGLHHGDAIIEEGGDVFGDAVNTAARMAALAKREQIVTTETTAAAAAAGNLNTRSLGEARVSGKVQPIPVVDVVWHEDTSNVTMVQRAIRIDDFQNVAGAKLVLRFRGRVIEISPASPALTLGRDPASSLVVDTEWVSRNHAIVEYKRGYFMLADRSTNGTWLKLGEDDELRLHRDEIHLRKSGSISLGQSVVNQTADALYYQCVG